MHIGAHRGGGHRAMAPLPMSQKGGGGKVSYGPPMKN